MTCADPFMTGLTRGARRMVKRALAAPDAVQYLAEQAKADPVVFAELLGATLEPVDEALPRPSAKAHASPAEGPTR